MFSAGGLILNLLQWVIAYLIEILKGDPELADLVRKNKWIFILTIIVMIFFAHTVYEHVELIKIDEQYKELKIEHETIKGKHQVLVTEHEKQAKELLIKQARVTRLEGLYDSKNNELDKALADIRKARDIIDKRDHIISEITNVKDKFLRDKLMSRLNDINKEFGH